MFTVLDNDSISDAGSADFGCRSLLSLFESVDCISLAVLESDGQRPDIPFRGNLLRNTNIHAPKSLFLHVCYLQLC